MLVGSRTCISLLIASPINKYVKLISYLQCICISYFQMYFLRCQSFYCDSNCAWISWHRDRLRLWLGAKQAWTSSYKRHPGLLQYKSNTHPKLKSRGFSFAHNTHFSYRIVLDICIEPRGNFQTIWQLNSKLWVNEALLDVSLVCFSDKYSLPFHCCCSQCAKG